MTARKCSRRFSAELSHSSSMSLVTKLMDVNRCYIKAVSVMNKASRRRVDKHRLGY
jgi:hypothetical protein